MKPIFVQLAAYNVWANHKLLFAIQQLDETLWYQQVPSSFNSLYKTILHLWDAESAWWQRIRMHEHIIIPSKNFEPSLKDACNGLIHQNMEWESFIKDIVDEEILHSNLIYKNYNGEEFSQPTFQVLMHLFNHGTYHRGQLVSMLRAMGVEQIPQTDFIVFTRHK